jgi:hypothetical protein
MGDRGGVAPAGGGASSGGAVKVRRRGGWCGVGAGARGSLI